MTGLDSEGRLEIAERIGLELESAAEFAGIPMEQVEEPYNEDPSTSSEHSRLGLKILTAFYDDWLDFHEMTSASGERSDQKYKLVDLISEAADQPIDIEKVNGRRRRFEESYVSKTPHGYAATTPRNPNVTPERRFEDHSEFEEEEFSIEADCSYEDAVYWLAENVEDHTDAINALLIDFDYELDREDDDEVMTYLSLDSEGRDEILDPDDKVQYHLSRLHEEGHFEQI